ncbi:MAG: chemotaxis response regulator protein-glutamate methylesterase [Acidobacteria bacterium]|nr:MAG: chemotaxis response regulator protein-glutamate methylesterase [Acidobacteriota bacterium]
MKCANGVPLPIRVLVVDDSAFTRMALTRMIESDPALCVTETAQSGQEALEKIALTHPDVVTLDVEMPGLNGLETLKRIMREFPCPVIMVSCLTQEDAEITLDALSCGAFDYVPKQLSDSSADIIKIRQELIAKIKAAADARTSRVMKRPARPMEAPAECPVAHSRYGSSDIVAVGISTGGPQALQDILPLLPADLPVGVLVVQHMPPGFTGPFAKRLNSLCKMTVREAAHNDPIEPGVVYIAPAGQHMTVYRNALSKAAIRISPTPKGMAHIPSVDVMMLSVAEVFRSAAMGVIMTGMGSDGLEGMRAIARKGGITIGQDESSCVVYGMPRVCAEDGILQRMVPLSEIPQHIVQATLHRLRA